MALQKSLPCWAIVLLGLFYISLRCDARAVNVSNTWTMPQEGLNVFYRFFRDRISWFEADAVCQFHHANLVTVDNSFQFDATRDLLRELDVNDIVWIGLMRPQSSERFMWSNSHPLVADTGYWAESLPLMESPLCAVIDPIRDYRWHALRCGGPETASFLCEMPVPSWADTCILKDMPNLTMQYMADTASIELIRNCEEEGLLRQSCKGKQDRERAIRELICPRERLEAQRINDITNSHFKSLQIINSIRTDNNENNDIGLLPLGQSYEGNGEDFGELNMPTEKNTVQRLIEQFNVDELMQADEPAAVKIPGEIPKPVKKTAAKKVVVAGEYPKKEKLQKNTQTDGQKWHKQQPVLALEDMMMGDQPQGEPEMPEHVQDDDESNEIMEPLPHKKKILPQDLKTMPSITERSLQESQESHEFHKAAEREKTLPTTAASTTTSVTSTQAASTATKIAATTTAKTSPITTAAATMAMTSEVPVPTTELPLTTTTLGHTSTVLPTTTQLSVTVGHPIHPQKSHNVIAGEPQHPHVKENADNSHFIPPMLLVKSHYVPPAKHEHGNHGPHIDMEQTVVATTISDVVTVTEPSKIDQSGEHTRTTATKATQTNFVSTLEQKQPTATSTTAYPTTNLKPLTDEPIKIRGTVQHLGSHAKIIDDTPQNTNHWASVELQKTTILKPINNEDLNKTTTADSHGASHAATTTTTPVTATTTAGKVALDPLMATTRPAQQYHTTETEAETLSNVELKENKTQQPILATSKTTAQPQAVAATGQRQLTVETTKRITTTTETTNLITSKSTEIAATSTEETEVHKTPMEASGAVNQQETILAATVAPSPIATTTTLKSTAATTGPVAETTEAPSSTHNFLKEETEAPFKPNRRRALTKPEAVSYFKKILG